MTMAPDVVIVDYGVGNVGSLSNMFRKLGKIALLSSDPTIVETARRLILPGVGSFDHAVIRLRNSGLIEPIIRATQRGVPVLGVCLGMQLLLDGSDEGSEPGLGLIPGRVKKFPVQFGEGQLRVPHMGWNTLAPAKQSKLLPNLGRGDRYYFVHSYYAVPADDADTLAHTTYGPTFASVLERGNIVAAQFHPEKSHRFGLKFLSDFSES